MKKIIISIFLIMSFQIFAADKEVTVDGFGAVQNGNMELAKKDATDDALRRALEMVMGAHVSAETIVENYQLVSDKIISKVSGYVKSYKVLESKENQGIITVKVSAVVKESELTNDLQLIQTTLERMNYPKFVIMIAEQNVDMTMFSFWWGGAAAVQTSLGTAEQAISSELLDKNFKIVDHNALQSGVKVSSAQQVVDISNQQVLEMNKNIDADIVIAGKAAARKGMNIANSAMISCQANVTLRAISLKDGRLLGSASGQAAKVNIDPVTGGSQAIEQATKDAGKKLIADIIRSFNQSLNNGDEIKIIIGNVPDAAAMFKTQKDITAVKNITAAILEKFEGKTAEFRVAFRGNSNGLAQILEGFGMKAKEISAKKIVLELK